MTTDDPPRNLLPTFASPSTWTMPEPTYSPDPDPTLTPLGTKATPAPGTRRLHPGDGSGSPSELVPQKPGRDESTRTETSSPASRPVTTAEATALVIGVLSVVTAGAAFLVQWRARRKLREPTGQQRRDIATPLAKILMRRADLSMLGPDIADLLQAGAATGAYLGDGPLLLPLHPDAGVPDNLQENPE